MCPCRSSELIGQGARVTGHTWRGWWPSGEVRGRLFIPAPLLALPAGADGACWKAESEKDVPVLVGHHFPDGGQQVKGVEEFWISFACCYFCSPELLGAVSVRIFCFLQRTSFAAHFQLCLLRPNTGQVDVVCWGMSLVPATASYSTCEAHTHTHTPVVRAPGIAPVTTIVPLPEVSHISTTEHQLPSRCGNQQSLSNQIEINSRLKVNSNLEHTWNLHHCSPAIQLPKATYRQRTIYPSIFRVVGEASPPSLSLNASWEQNRLHFS